MPLAYVQQHMKLLSILAPLVSAELGNFHLFPASLSENSGRQSYDDLNFVLPILTEPCSAIGIHAYKHTTPADATLLEPTEQRCMLIQYDLTLHDHNSIDFLGKNII
jgi:hypothetical protein